LSLQCDGTRMRFIFNLHSYAWLQRLWHQTLSLGGGVGHETIKQALYVILLFGFTVVVVKEVPYIGKFSRCKRFAWKNFTEYNFHAMGLPRNLTCGENVEEYGRDWCIGGCHVDHESGRQLLAQLHHDGRHTCQFRPKQWDCSMDGFFHFSICCSNCLGLYWGQQRTSWIRKSVMVFRCWKTFMHVIFAVTDNREKFLAVKISQYTVQRRWETRPPGLMFNVPSGRYEVNLSSLNLG